MNNQLGRILYVDPNQFQKAVNTEGLTRYFNEMRLNKQKDFLMLVESIFQNGSGNRSHFFMEMAYRNYASYIKGFEYRMPFFGVKGRISGMTRTLNYTELLTCKREELQGAGFSDLIFGTMYMTAQQGMAQSESELLDLIQQDRKRVSHTLKEEEILDTCMVLEKLWEVQEADPTTRFIIRMKDPDGDGFDLLKRMYMLIPQGLRFQLGFETNIGEADLQQINQIEVPIYVMTSDESVDFSSAAYRFPIVVFDYENRGQYQYNPKRMELLEKTAREMNDLNTVFLDYAEKKTIEDKNARYSSFKFYEDIVNRANDSTNYWWRNEKVETVEELKAQYDDQRQLLNNDELYQEALHSLLTKILPKSNLAPQFAKLLGDKNYPNRAELLSFLKNELYQSTQIDAMTLYGQTIYNETKEYTEKEKQYLLKQYQAAIVDARNKTAAEKDQEIAKLKSDADREISSLEKQIEELQSEMAIRDTEEVSGEDAPEASGKLKRKLERAEKTAGIMKIGCIAAGVLCAIAIIAAVVFMVGGSFAKRDLADSKATVTELTKKSDQLEQEKSQLEKDKEEIQKQLDEAKAKLEELEAPAEELSSDIDMGAVSEAADEAAAVSETDQQAPVAEGGEEAPSEEHEQ